MQRQPPHKAQLDVPLQVLQHGIHHRRGHRQPTKPQQQAPQLCPLPRHDTPPHAPLHPRRHVRQQRPHHQTTRLRVDQQRLWRRRRRNRNPQNLHQPVKKPTMCGGEEYASGSKRVRDRRPFHVPNPTADRLTAHGSLSPIQSKPTVRPQPPLSHPVASPHPHAQTTPRHPVSPQTHTAPSAPVRRPGAPDG